MTEQRPPQRTGERVYDALKQRLLDGSYQRGARLHADQLTAELGVSRQPVFDAFKRLSTEGLVTVRPHVGCSVATFEMSEVRDWFKLFAAVEGAATALAAERRAPGDLRALRLLHAQIGGLSTLDDNEQAYAYRTLNRQFHSSIHAMCVTPVVERFGSAMYDQADFFINGSASLSPFAGTVESRHQEHGRILEALEAGDAEAARSAASDHIAGTVALIERALEAPVSEAA